MTKIKNDVKVQINALNKAGFKPAAIAREVGLSYETVKKYVYRSKLVEGLPAKVKLPKGYFTGRIPSIIRIYLVENPTATLEQIIAGCELKTSVASLSRYLNTNNLQRTKAKRNILLRDVSRVKRLAFAKMMLEKTEEERRSILWSDETMVKAYPNGEAVFYRSIVDRSDIVAPVVQQSGAGQMLWGCLSINAYGPLRAIEGHINGKTYLKLLQDVVRPELVASRALGKILVFQHDNAKPHTAEPVREYLKNWGYEVIDWPPQSPDLSPIEIFWNIMKMKMKALRPRPRKKAEMREAMMDIWLDLDKDLLERVVGTFTARLRECVANNGGLVTFF